MAGKPVPRQIGRFTLRSLLGQGAQAEVWLAHDPRLDRDVALKLVTNAGADDVEGDSASWLKEARAVSRLNHPHIVPIFEADVHERQRYLVFEYVSGSTLAQFIRARGALPPSQAVDIVLQILDALVAAHAAGVIHRDLKPGNVLQDAQGRWRVMDFGIAARVPDANQTTAMAVVAGTPAYMAPEALRGEPVSAQVDIYAAGLVLAELLLGHSVRTISHGDIQLAAQRPLVFPTTLLEGLDDVLRSALLRATAFDPTQRYTNVASFQQALREWTSPAPAVPAPGSATGSSATLDFLLRRMRGRSDFPALSESIVRIQSMASSDKESVGSITNEILKNVALTNKLLRLVNSAHYARSAPIGTVSRAVSLVGFNGIRNMALSLVLLEHMQDKTNAEALKEEFLRALMAGSLAAELCGDGPEGEEAFIGALFQNLGRMLTQFYFPEEAARIKHLMIVGKGDLSEAAAATQVLGSSFVALGVGVAKAWGLPEGIQRCMQRPVGDPATSAGRVSASRLHWGVTAANDMADAMVHPDPSVVDARLVQLGKRYGAALGMGSEAVQHATARARSKVVDLAKAMEITVRAQSGAACLLRTTSEVPSADQRGATSEAALPATELQATAIDIGAQSRSPAQQRQEDAAQILAAGVQDITDAMVDDFKLTDILRMILEAMFRGLEFHRILFCLRDARTEALTGRFGLGDSIDDVVRQFQVPLGPGGTPDLFATICSKGADTLISDASDPRIAQSLPAWYVRGFHAPTFLILPLQLKNRPFGLIYADKMVRGSLQISERELSLLRTLRNQAVMAFRQSSMG